MMKIGISVLTMVLILCLYGIVQADIVDISVATDKTTYLVGEEVRIYISAYNPDIDSVRLTFSTPIQTSYWMDESYYWHPKFYYTPVVTYAIINPNATHTWELIHSSDELSEYPLNIGIHSVAGIVGAFELENHYTESVEFEVIPEPSSLLLLTTGCVYLLQRKNATAKRQEFKPPCKL